MLTSTVPNLKTLDLNHANSHNYFTRSTDILKHMWFQVLDPGKSSPALCLCILQVYAGCKTLLQSKRWNPQAGQLLSRWINIINLPEVLPLCQIVAHKKGLTTCAFKNNNSRWLRSVSSIWRNQVLGIIFMTEATSWPRFRCKGYLCVNVTYITKVTGRF